jgi:hypothetical protein
LISSINIYCKPTYFKRRVERHFSSKMKRKSRDWDLTLELSCHAGCPTDLGMASLENSRPTLNKHSVNK